jgi:3'-phosphoadenosine 5'-phosphosulfate sulfotransferase (PAPS reductase)/FAD synthetase
LFGTEKLKMALENRIREAKEILKEAVKKSQGPLFLNFSGGKDSCSLVSLASGITDNMECIYMKSGIDLPGSVEFVEKQCRNFGLKLHITDPVRDYMGDFRFWVTKKMGYFPATSYAYCSTRLKLRPERAYLRKLYGKTPLCKCTGVRLNESSRRKKMYAVKGPMEKDWEHSGSFIAHPLINWTDNDVKDYLKLVGFEINENYKPFGVSGCYYCPFYQPSIYVRILKGLPHIYDDIIRMEYEIGKPSIVGNRFLRDIKWLVMEEGATEENIAKLCIGRPNQKAKPANGNEIR